MTCTSPPESDRWHPPGSSPRTCRRHRDRRGNLFTSKRTLLTRLGLTKQPGICTCTNQDAVRGARRAKPGPGAQECPYPGLASFGREQARWFFGRDELTADLIMRLDARLSTGGVQVVVAPSGAGKSSLLNAGLLQMLEYGALPGSSRWPTIGFTPTAHPLAALVTQIAALTGADPTTLAGELAAGSPSAGAVLRQVLLRGIGGEDAGARLVMTRLDGFRCWRTRCGPPGSSATATP